MNEVIKYTVYYSVQYSTPRSPNYDTLEQAIERAKRYNEGRGCFIYRHKEFETGWFAGDIVWRMEMDEDEKVELLESEPEPPFTCIECGNKTWKIVDTKCSFCLVNESEPICPNCGLIGEAAKLPHSCRRPEQGEFTKEFREQLEFNKNCYIQSKTTTMGFEACDRIDRLEAENKELKEKLNERC